MLNVVARKYFEDKSLINTAHNVCVLLLLYVPYRHPILPSNYIVIVFDTAGFGKSEVVKPYELGEKTSFKL